ncbi:MAG TPA: hypothetical protein VNO19_02445 [Gemmatimonadales bacterium]|nr:hypothetical protein [Gemmatimonadales bacterium]
MRLEILSRVRSSPPSSEVPATARPLRSWLLCGIGAVCAIAVVELGLVPLTTPLNNVWSPILADRLDGEVREVRRFTETIAASHFSLSRARLTGNPPLSGAATGVILGDSHVEAVEVPDRETMGAIVERSLRSADTRINVRQYGWYGSDVPKYVQVAPEITQVWDPVWVVVVITASDLGPDILTAGVRLVRGTDGHWGVTAESAPARIGRARKIAEQVLSSSGLIYHLAKRGQTAGLPIIRAKNEFGAGKASLRPGGIPLPERTLIALDALREAYGERLRILFATDVGIDGLAPESPAENAVLAACASLGLRCASTRAPMIQDRLDSARLSRGFTNSVPGEGHLNTVGHTLAAETILRNLVRVRP